MEIEQVNIVDIVPYENNPRKNDKAVEIVEKSIREFGFLVPVILDDKNCIVAGHTRIKAAIKLGMQSVPAIYTEGLTKEQINAFRIMDNKSQEYAEWDYDKLKEEFCALEDTDYFFSTGFTTEEISSIWDGEMDIKQTDFKKIEIKLIFDKSEKLKEVYRELEPILAKYSIKVKINKQIRELLEG